MYFQSRAIFVSVYSINLEAEMASFASRSSSYCMVFPAMEIYLAGFLRTGSQKLAGFDAVGLQRGDDQVVQQIDTQRL